MRGGVGRRGSCLGGWGEGLFCGVGGLCGCGLAVWNWCDEGWACGVGRLWVCGGWWCEFCETCGVKIHRREFFVLSSGIFCFIVGKKMFHRHDFFAAPRGGIRGISVTFSALFGYFRTLSVMFVVGSVMFAVGSVMFVVGSVMFVVGSVYFATDCKVMFFERCVWWKDNEIPRCGRGISVCG